MKPADRTRSDGNLPPKKNPVGGEAAFYFPDGLRNLGLSQYEAFGR